MQRAGWNQEQKIEYEVIFQTLWFSSWTWCGGGGGWFQRALLIVSETRFEGIFVYVLIVKLVHLFILFFTHITQ